MLPVPSCGGLVVVTVKGSEDRAVVTLNGHVLDRLGQRVLRLYEGAVADDGNICVYEALENCITLRLESASPTAMTRKSISESWYLKMKRCQKMERGSPFMMRISRKGNFIQ